MYDLLKDMRVVEGSAFVAAPLCGLTLAQFGAEVIRFDAIGGGPDYHRWPLAESGQSLYWMGLNKGKKSIAIDLRREEGRELACNLVTAPGKTGGYFVTNFPVDGFLSHEELTKRREDLVSVRVMGNPDGRTAVDYTVNCSVGYPDMTGAIESAAPVNHVLPAWDLITGMGAAFGLLAAARRRSETGKGVELRIALSDIAFAMTANLGMLAEVALGGGDRPRCGNAIYGAFGRDFESEDGRRVMIVAITQRQWTSLVAAAEIGAEVESLEREVGSDFKDEGARFVYRAQLEPLVEQWAKSLPYKALAERLDVSGACWGPYQTISEALARDPRCSLANPIFESLAHPGVEAHLTPGSPIDLRGEQRLPVRPAPVLGEHTDEILANVMGFSSGEIGRLHDRGLVAGPEAA